MNLQRFAGPNEPDNEGFLKLFEVDVPTDEFGNEIPKEETPETKVEPIAEPEKVPEVVPEPETQVEPTPEPEKKVQTPEENSKFAEMRRQKQVQEQADKLAKERLENSPEYKVAKTLADQYGMTTEQLLEKMQEALVQKQAKEQGVPVEIIQQINAEKQARQELEQRLNQTEFTNWMSQMDQQKAELKAKYSVLTDDDLTDAVHYQLTELKNTKLPLEKAVFALHGAKITAEIQRVAKQEALAEISGRKQSPLAPQQGATANDSSVAQLTAEEHYVAKKMGMTPEEYAKYK
jgi:hypothetical protein